MTSSLEDVAIDTVSELQGHTLEHLRSKLERFGTLVTALIQSSNREPSKQHDPSGFCRADKPHLDV